MLLLLRQSKFFTIQALKHGLRNRANGPANIQNLSSGSHIGRRPQPISLSRPPSLASFHATSKRQGAPLIALLAPIFKASIAIEIARTTSRIALTFLPAVLIGRTKSARMMRHARTHGVQISDEKRERYMKRLRRSTRALQLILFIPFAVFWMTIMASLEKTPLTGRWRTILLSPEEEDEISAQLAGQGWYNAVHEVLAQDGEPSFIPPSDWRYQWVRNTFERLLSIIPILADELHRAPNWVELGPDERPLPPPASHPLHPRPRAADYIHSFCQHLRVLPENVRSQEPEEFSLLLVDSPGDSNAFSYGFWPNGGHGVVVYSGFLDDIFSKIPLEYSAPPDDRSWFSKLFNITPPPQRLPVITEAQTTDLAVLLAHELSHLILAHHLESISGATIVVPGTLSILADVIRVVIFPITMFFGPFVNDAVAHLGNVGSSELKKIGEWCTTSKQEVEADIVSARLLAYAGFDARDAITFWERRGENETECHTVERDRPYMHKFSGVVPGTGHPTNSNRVDILRQEISRWEEARRAAVSASR